MTIAAIAGAIAYGAAQGVYRAVAEHRRTIGGNLGPRTQDSERRIAYIEGLLGIKPQIEDVTPHERPPFNRND